MLVLNDSTINIQDILCYSYVYWQQMLLFFQGQEIKFSQHWNFFICSYFVHLLTCGKKEEHEINKFTLNRIFYLGKHWRTFSEIGLILWPLTKETRILTIFKNKLERQCPLFVPWFAIHYYSTYFRKIQYKTGKNVIKTPSSSSYMYNLLKKSTLILSIKSQSLSTVVVDTLMHTPWVKNKWRFS